MKYDYPLATSELWAKVCPLEEHSKPSSFHTSNGQDVNIIHDGIKMTSKGSFIAKLGYIMKSRRYEA